MLDIQFRYNAERQFATLCPPTDRFRVCSLNVTSENHSGQPARIEGDATVRALLSNHAYLLLALPRFGLIKQEVRLGTIRAGDVQFDIIVPNLEYWTEGFFVAKFQAKPRVVPRILFPEVRVIPALGEGIDSKALQQWIKTVFDRGKQFLATQVTSKRINNCCIRCKALVRQERLCVHVSIDYQCDERLKGGGNQRWSGLCRVVKIAGRREIQRVVEEVFL